MHGQYIRILIDSLLVKKTQSYGYQGEMWKEKQSEIIAAQDQALANKYHYKKLTDRSWKQMKTVNNLTRQQNAYQHAS